MLDGTGQGAWLAEVCEELAGSGFVVLPDVSGCVSRELDETELRELKLWARDGFTGRTSESTT